MLGFSQGSTFDNNEEGSVEHDLSIASILLLVMESGNDGTDGSAEMMMEVGTKNHCPQRNPHT